MEWPSIWNDFFGVQWTSIWNEFCLGGVRFNLVRLLLGGRVNFDLERFFGGGVDFNSESCFFLGWSGLQLGMIFFGWSGLLFEHWHNKGTGPLFERGGFRCVRLEKGSGHRLSCRTPHHFRHSNPSHKGPPPGWHTFLLYLLKTRAIKLFFSSYQNANSPNQGSPWIIGGTLFWALGCGFLFGL